MDVPCCRSAKVYTCPALQYTPWSCNIRSGGGGGDGIPFYSVSGKAHDLHFYRPSSLPPSFSCVRLSALFPPFPSTLSGLTHVWTAPLFPLSLAAAARNIVPLSKIKRFRSKVGGLQTHAFAQIFLSLSVKKYQMFRFTRLQTSWSFFCAGLAAAAGP